MLTQVQILRKSFPVKLSVKKDLFVKFSQTLSPQEPSTLKRVTKQRDYDYSYDRARVQQFLNLFGQLKDTDKLKICLKNPRYVQILSSYESFKT